MFVRRMLRYGHAVALVARGGPMQVAEQDTMPDTIEATLNYLLNTGEKPVTYVGVPGGVDTRSSATLDPRRVTIRNGRPYADRFTLDRDGFRFVRHDTKVTNFFDEDEVRSEERRVG